MIDSMPNLTYSVTLADLIEIADAACHLDAYKSMLVDRPGEVQTVQRSVEKLHDIAERAAGQDAVRIYGQEEGDPCAN